MTKKRSKIKYPNIDISVNTKSRTDYIETDYVNGVRNKDGELVIRAMTDDETAWLDNFYGESLICSSKNLNPTEEIQDYAKKKSSLKKRIAKERKDTGLKTNRRIVFLENKIIKIEECLDFLREEAGVLHPTCEEQRRLFRDNNKRNKCIYNNLKSRGMLLELTTETYDSFIGDYWDILTNLTGNDSQDVIIEEIEKRLRGNFLPHELSDSDDDTDES